MGIAIVSLSYNEQSRGLILSAFFFGYIATQILGGICAYKYGAKVVLMVGVTLWTLFDLSTALSADFSLWLLIGCRIGMGLGEGVNYPCLHQIASAWFPIQERTTLLNIVSAGQDVGTVAALLISPIIAAYWGWKFIFVTFGMLNVLWLVVFYFIGAGSPESDCKISSEELHLIQLTRTSNSNSSALDHKSISWKTLLTSRASLSIFASHVSYNYGWYVLLSWLPQYFKEVLKFDLKTHSIVAAAPYMFGGFSAFLTGILSDYIVRKQILSLKYTRKLMNSIGLVGPAILLVLVSKVDNSTVAVAMLCLVLFLGRFIIAGYWVNMIDVGPCHAGQIMGLSNTLATIPGIVGNALTGWILQSTGSWNTVFCVAAGVNLFGALVFLIGSEGKPVFNSKGEKIIYENIDSDGYQKLEYEDLDTSDGA